MNHMVRFPLHFRIMQRKFSSLNYQGNKTLGIVREEYRIWERRSPLSPEHVKKLVDKGFKVLIQPCTRRIFSNRDFKVAGAEITEDITKANLIIGIKRIPAKNILEGKSYMFFR